jgi:hypothetical protein
MKVNRVLEYFSSSESYVLLPLAGAGGYVSSSRETGSSKLPKLSRELFRSSAQPQLRVHAVLQERSAT